MSVKVNPPPQVRIPDQFARDQEVRSFFEQQRTILFQLWQRTGGSRDNVAGRQVIIITSTDIILDTYGILLVVDASGGPVQVTLPVISQDNTGENLDVAIVDATHDTTVIGQSATIFGESSVIMTQQYMSIQYTAITKTAWIGT